MKITRRQLRRLIETVVAGTEPGDAVDLETVSTVSSVNQEKYNNVIDSLIKMFPADQASKLSVMLKSDDPENVNMGLALADSLSMSMENEKEIQTLIRRLENISQTVAVAKDFEDNPHRPINWGSGSHPIEYPIFEEIEDAIYSVIKDNLGDLFNFAISHIRADSYEIESDDGLSSETYSGGGMEPWKVPTFKRIITLMKSTNPKIANYLDSFFKSGKVPKEYEEEFPGRHTTTPGSVRGDFSPIEHLRVFNFAMDRKISPDVIKREIDMSKVAKKTGTKGKFDAEPYQSLSSLESISPTIPGYSFNTLVNRYFNSIVRRDRVPHPYDHDYYRPF